MSDRWRPAGVTDLPMIFRAERSYIEAVEPAQQQAWTSAIDRNLALWIDNLPRTTVLEIDGDDGVEPKGFVMWAREDDPSSALLVTVQVQPDSRRQGLGLRLLERFAEQAKADGRHVLHLGVHEANPSRGIYVRAGFQEIGRDGAYLLYARNA